MKFLKNVAIKPNKDVKYSTGWPESLTANSAKKKCYKNLYNLRFKNEFSDNGLSFTNNFNIKLVVKNTEGYGHSEITGGITLAKPLAYNHDTNEITATIKFNQSNSLLKTPVNLIINSPDGTFISPQFTLSENTKSKKEKDFWEGINSNKISKIEKPQKTIAKQPIFVTDGSPLHYYYFFTNRSNNLNESGNNHIHVLDKNLGYKDPNQQEEQKYDQIFDSTLKNNRI